MAELTHDEQDDLAKAIIDRDHDCAHNMVPLIRAVEEIVEARLKEALLAEAAWLSRARSNAHPELYSREYFRGFESAAGWVKFHGATPGAFRHLKGGDGG